MALVKDLTGLRYGELIVKRRTTNQGQKSAWVCRCSCGKEITVRADNLSGGYQTSCGCVGNEKLAAINRKKRKISIAYASASSPSVQDRPTGQPLRVDPVAAIDLASCLGMLGAPPPTLKLEDEL